MMRQSTCSVSDRPDSVMYEKSGNLLCTFIEGECIMTMYVYYIHTYIHLMLIDIARITTLKVFIEKPLLTRCLYNSDD